MHGFNFVLLNITEKQPCSAVRLKSVMLDSCLVRKYTVVIILATSYKTQLKIDFNSYNTTQRK